MFEISALTREGCEPLVHDDLTSYRRHPEAEQPHVDVDPSSAVREQPADPRPGPAPRSLIPELDAMPGSEGCASRFRDDS